MGRRHTAILILVTALLALSSVIVRYHFVETRPLAGRLDGQEPESHILVTDLAFNQTPASVHKYLPIFTLGKFYDKFIDQHPGASTPDKAGNYFYTSTPPLTFVLPYLAMRGDPTLQGLRWYNISLQLAAAMALGWLIYLCLRGQGRKTEISVALGLAGTAIYMTAPECLRSHSINLWSQQFYAVLLPIQIIILLFRPYWAAIAAAAFLGCLTDWTAYVANVAMALVGFYDFRKTGNRRSLESGLILIGATGLAGLVMIAWFAQVMPITDYFANLMRRSEARALGGDSKLLLFAPRYVESLGLFLPLLIALLLGRSKIIDPKDEPSRLPKVDPLHAAVFIWVFALLENLLMKDHALNYSYDRLKGVQLLAIGIAWAASANIRQATVAFWLSTGVGLLSLWMFYVSYETPYGTNYLVRSQQERIGSVIARTASQRGPAFFNGDVRGSEVYYAGRNIVQIGEDWPASTHIDKPAYARAWLRDHNYSEGTLYTISGNYPWVVSKQLPRSLDIATIYADGRVGPSQTVILPEKAGDYHAKSQADRASMIPNGLW